MFGLGFVAGSSTKGMRSASMGSVGVSHTVRSIGAPSEFKTLTSPSGNVAAPSTSSLVDKRLEYAEDQIKKSQENHVSDREKIRDTMHNSTRALYAEMQWVYCKASVANLKGRTKWNDCSSPTEVVAHKKNEKMLFVYPMKRHTVKATAPDEVERDEYVMRCKTVHPDTGQIQMFWVVVHEVVKTTEGDKHYRNVHSFGFT